MVAVSGPNGMLRITDTSTDNVISFVRSYRYITQVQFVRQTWYSNPKVQFTIIILTCYR